MEDNKDKIKLRDLFASRAMDHVKFGFYVGEMETKQSLYEAAEKCYRIADAMMAVREKSQAQQHDKYLKPGEHAF